METEPLLAASGAEQGATDFKDGGSYGRGSARKSTIWNRSESDAWN